MLLTNDYTHEGGRFVYADTKLWLWSKRPQHMYLGVLGATGTDDEFYEWVSYE